MGRTNQRRELAVAMNGAPVGRWSLHAGRHSFRYEEAWLSQPDAIPISLSMPLSADEYRDDRVPNFFDNLLPDNTEIRTRLQTRFGTRTRQPFDLLASIGGDCVGALQIHAAGEPPADVRTITADPVDDEQIAATLRDYRAQPLGMQVDHEFRISIAGAQEKTALLWHDGRWHRPRGTTPTSHIVKQPIGDVNGIDLTDSVENEWLCLRIAAAFGLPVAAAEMCSFGDRRALVVERFDRRWSRDATWLQRLPQEDMCQALMEPPARKYEHDGGPGITAILETLRQAQQAEHDRQTFFRAQVLFWLLAGTDGHAKNFSLFLLPGGRCRLTPIYDVLSTHPIVASGQLHPHRLKMAMAVTGKNRHHGWDQIRGRHWLTTADAARFPRRQARAILERFADEGEAALQRVQDELPEDFPPHVADPIFAGVRATIARIGTLD